MPRLITSILLIVFALSVIGLTVSRAVSTPDEVLAVPARDPENITPDIPTFVTFTIDLSHERPWRAPMLQVFDPATNSWVRVKKLRDNGRRTDAIKGDLVYTLRVQLLDTDGTTHLHVPLRNGELDLRASVQSPAKLRVIARRSQTLQRIVSPEFSLTSSDPKPIVIEDSTNASPVALAVPQTIKHVEMDMEGRVRLTKSGADGYVVVISVMPNSDGLNLNEWIHVHTFGSDDIDRSARLLSVTSGGGLDGFKYESVSEAGPGMILWFDDFANARIIEVTVNPGGGEQLDNFADNLPEIDALIDSLSVSQ